MSDRKAYAPSPAARPPITIAARPVRRLGWPASTDSPLERAGRVVESRSTISAREKAAAPALSARMALGGRSRRAVSREARPMTKRMRASVP